MVIHSVNDPLVRGVDFDVEDVIVMTDCRDLSAMVSIYASNGLFHFFSPGIGYHDEASTIVNDVSPHICISQFLFALLTLFTSHGCGAVFPVLYN